MSIRYKFRNQERLHFVSFAVVYWIDVCYQTGLVSKAEDYVYSSARDYSGESGLLTIKLLT